MKENPPKSRAEAQARRIRPPFGRHEPEKLTHWSLPMTVIWIMSGDYDLVREQWDNYRKECADWLFYSDPKARADLHRTLLSQLSSNEVLPNDPDLDQRLKSGSWHLTPWRPSGWHDVLYETPDMSGSLAAQELWSAAGEGKIVASAVQADGTYLEIPSYMWPRLVRTHESSGKASLTAASIVFRDVQLKRSEVQKLWPSADESDGEKEQTFEKTGAPGRPTSMHLVEEEFLRRVQIGENKDSMRAEAAFLADWLVATHPNAPRLTPKTISNRLAPIKRQLECARK